MVAPLSIRAFPPGRSGVDRVAIREAFRRAGLKAAAAGGPVVPVGLNVVDDDGHRVMMVLVFTPAAAATLVAAVESVGLVDRGAVHAARARLARSSERPTKDA